MRIKVKIVPGELNCTLSKMLKYVLITLRISMTLGVWNRPRVDFMPYPL